MRRLLGASLVCAAVLGTSGVVALRGTLPDSAGTDPAALAVPYRAACPDRSADVAALGRRLTAGSLGTGATPYPGNPVAESAVAEAAMLSAAALCARDGSTVDRTAMDALGDLLLGWSDRHPSTRGGWGTPVAIDPDGNGSVNAENTVYAMTTALVVRALLDWSDVSDASVGARVRPVAERALVEWLAPTAVTGAGLFVVSLDANDAAVDSSAASAMLAGQLQRFANFRTSARSAELAARADDVVRSLSTSRRTGRLGDWYWNASSRGVVPNELADAALLSSGLGSYVEARGALADTLSMPSVRQHLRSFLSDGTASEPVVSRPVWSSRSLPATDRVPSLAALGWAMAEVGPHADDELLMVEPLCTLATRYTDASGALFARPVEEAGQSGGPEIYEFVAVRYLGAVAFGEGTCDRTLGTYADVPFVEFATGTSSTTLAMDTTTWRPRLRSGGRSLDVPRPSVPLAVFADPSATVAVIRGIPGNELAFVRWPTGQPPGFVPIGGQSDSALELRASTHAGRDLFLVVHDAARAESRLQRYSFADLRLEREWVLPSVDADGRVFAATTTDGRLHVAYGTVHAVLRDDDLAVDRLAGCDGVLESIVVGPDVSALCRAGESGYVVVGPSGPTAVTAVGVPFGLRADAATGALGWSDSAVVGDAAWLEFELGHLPNSGTADLGVNNREGRVASSQLAYLSGLLDAASMSAYRKGDARFDPLGDRVRARLAVEIRLLERVVETDGLASREGTTDRSRALRARDLARLVTTSNRFRAEVPGVPALPAIERFVRGAARLDGALEVVDRAGIEGLVPEGRAYLRWPKGSAVRLDGANLPYSTQNEWAQAVVQTDGPGDQAIADARDMLGAFYDAVLVPNGGTFPAPGAWPATSGTGASGWGADARISANTPVYAGDRDPASIEARSSDARAMLVWSTILPADRSRALRENVADLVSRGVVLPRTAGTLRFFVDLPEVSDDVFHGFGRAATPAGVGDAVWAHALHTG